MAATPTRPPRVRTSTRAQGRPSRAKHDVRGIDTAAIAAQARETALGRLSGDQDPQEALAQAVALIADLEPKVEALRLERNELALSATIYDNVRGVFNYAGVSRNMISRLKRDLAGGAVPTRPGITQPDNEELVRIAKEKGLPHRTDWAERLPDVAEQWTALDAELRAAREIRNELVVALVNNGDLAPSQAAKIIGRGQARVANLVTQLAHH